MAKGWKVALMQGGGGARIPIGRHRYQGYPHHAGTLHPAFVHGRLYLQGIRGDFSIQLPAQV